MTNEIKPSSLKSIIEEIKTNQHDLPPEPIYRCTVCETETIEIFRKCTNCGQRIYYKVNSQPRCIRAL